MGRFIVLPTRAVEPSSDDKAAVVKGNTAFAIDLHRHVGSQDDNLFFAPYSISTAMAMTYAGARGETAQQMASVFYYTLAQDKLHPACGRLLKDLSGDGKKRSYQLSLVNLLWGQSGYGFQADFLQTTRINYMAGLTELDFKNDPEAARTTINQVIEKQTQEKIKELVPSGIITTNTRLVLTNAIYFKAGWNSNFDKKNTTNAPFRVTSERSVNVPTMHQTESFPFRKGEDFDVLELPYLDNDLSMVILLPKKADGLAELEKSLTTASLEKALAKLHSSRVTVSMPRFKMTGAFLLKKPLSKMGMPLAFGLQADLSGINGNKDLLIQEVVHKTFVAVDEEGTEAAGATAVVEGIKSLAPKFNVDHPFLFLIRENRSGTILFMGRVIDPSK